MTVIVLSKSNGHYYMTGDGRTSMGWMGIASDTTQKVHQLKDCLYGVCGNASAKMIIEMLLKRTRDPKRLIKLLLHKDFKDILQDCEALIATQKFGCYTISISNGHPMFKSSGSSEIITWSDESLPQISGSGSLNVKTLLSVNHEDKPTPEQIVKSIEASYKVNHTIGGTITQVSLKSTGIKEKKIPIAKPSSKKKVSTLKGKKSKVKARR